MGYSNYKAVETALKGSVQRNQRKRKHIKIVLLITQLKEIGKNYKIKSIVTN